MYVSQPHPLQFWLRLQTRLADALASGGRRLAEYRDLVAPANVDDADQVRGRMASARDAALKLLTELENLQILLMVVENQVRIAAFNANLPAIEGRLACMRGLTTLYGTGVAGLPSRGPAEQDLATLETRFRTLRTSQGESVTAEKARVRDTTVSLRALGHEDGEAYEAELRKLETGLDQLEAEAQAIRVSTFVALQVPDESASIMVAFGVPVSLVEPPTQAQADVGAVQEEGSATEAAILDVAPADSAAVSEAA